LHNTCNLIYNYSWNWIQFHFFFLIFIFHFYCIARVLSYFFNKINRETWMVFLCYKTFTKFSVSFNMLKETNNFRSIIFCSFLATVLRRPVSTVAFVPFEVFMLFHEVRAHNFKHTTRIYCIHFYKNLM